MDGQGIAIEKERQIKSEIGKLTNSVNEIENRINALVGRLTPALRSGTPTCEEVNKTPETELVELAADIRANRYVIERQNGIINDILDRLEI